MDRPPRRTGPTEDMILIIAPDLEPRETEPPNNSVNVQL